MDAGGRRVQVRKGELGCNTTVAVVYYVVVCFQCVVYNSEDQSMHVS